MDEISRMSILQHTNIVTLFGLCDDTIITEYMALGTVKDYLSARQKIDIPPLVVVLIAKDITKGMQYLSEKKVIHRDLAARNVLLQNEADGMLIAKVADFGLSREGDYYTTEPTKEHDPQPIKWTCPEAITRKKTSCKGDVWSFGIVIYELFEFCKSEPFPLLSIPDVAKMFENQDPIKPHFVLSDAPIDIQAMLNSCLNYVPKDRPTFTKLEESLSTIQLQVEQNNKWQSYDTEMESPIENTTQT